MSWYVQNLIRNSWYIKNRIIKEESRYIKDSSIADLSQDDFEDLFGFRKNEDDSYDDLLSVESVFSKLKLTKRQKEILYLLSLNNDISIMAKTLRLSRPTIKTRIKELTDRVALILGDRFTNEGYAQYIADKYGYDHYVMLSVLTYLTEKE